MTNANCLEGIACPKCGNDSRIIIEARTLAEVTDDGAETFGSMEWDEGSFTECPECGHYGELSAFRTEPATEHTTQTREE